MPVNICTLAGLLKYPTGRQMKMYHFFKGKGKFLLRNYKTMHRMEDISQIYKSKIFSSCWLNGVLISVILGMQILMENSVALRLPVHQDVTSIFTSTGQIVLLKVEIIGKMHIGTMHWSGISIARVSLHYSQLHKPHGCGRYSHGTFIMVS